MRIHLSLSVFCGVALGSTPILAQDLLVTSWPHHSVKRYDGQTGAFIDDFVASGSGGLQSPHSAIFGPDGDFYVTSFSNNRVLRYDESGDFVEIFVSPGDGGLAGPTDAFFGPDGNLYVSSRGATPGVKRYDQTTGDFIDNFIKLPGGLANPHGIEFRPDGMVYIANYASGGANTTVKRYLTSDGSFVDEFVSAGAGGLSGAISLTFDPGDTLNVAASANTFRAYGAEPGEGVVFLIGVGLAGAGSQAIGHSCGGEMLIGRSLLVATAIADSNGVANASWTVPAALSGMTLKVQAAAPRACLVSHVILHPLP